MAKKTKINNWTGHGKTIVHKTRTRCKCGSADIVCDGGTRTYENGRTVRYCHCRACGASVIEIVD